MKNFLLVLSGFLLFSFSVLAQNDSRKVSGPDGQLEVQVRLVDGQAFYSVRYKGAVMLEDSPLGLVSSVSDFSSDLQWHGSREDHISKHYQQDRIKHSKVHYEANVLLLSLANAQGQVLEIEFQVSNNDVAFRYHLPAVGETATCIVKQEITGFRFPKGSTTFLSPQSPPMVGWMRTKPSYEEPYIADEALGTPSRYGVGYTFPGLFKTPNEGWILVSETGVDASYCGSRLSEGSPDGLYSIAYPQSGENNGHGSAEPALALPGTTPWRTLTVGSSLKPIVETTIYTDVVAPRYEASQEYRFGRSTWSWIMWQDASMNYDDQVRYIDLAAEMGYEYILIDALWDTEIGYDRMATLIAYAQSKNVDVFLWYNSNGHWNDAPQGPRHKLHNPIVRKKEMAWMQSQGVKGIKVDFLGGDKQVTMQLYEAILSDANDYGLMVNFHGCTLPRGWERMYPNYIGSEAVLASENLIFGQHANDQEAYNACLHPFIRNAVGSMEFGPVLLNRRHNRSNDGGTTRRTTDAFQLSTAILFQNAVQFFALAPNNLQEFPAFVIDFMKEVPTTWDETVFIDGYPGRYVVLARRHGEQWYIAGANATGKALTLDLELPMLAGTQLTAYTDTPEGQVRMSTLKINRKGKLSVAMQAEGGFVLVR